MLLVGVAGYFGARLAEIGRRVGAKVTEVTGEWARPRPDDPAARRKASASRCWPRARRDPTGVVTAPAPLRAVADELGALLVADCVTTLAACRSRRRLGHDGAYPARRAPGRALAFA
jgi:aspartate aminotransferase-like enzyme